MGADMENPDAGDYVAVTTTEPNKELNKWFYRLLYCYIFGLVICFHYMLVFDPASFRMVVVTNMCGLLLYSCSFIAIYKYFPPKRTGVDVENPDVGDYVAVITTEPNKELNKWIHGVMFCYVFVLIIYVHYKLVKLALASLGLIVVIELCWLLVSCCNSVLLYKSFHPENSKLLP